MSCESIFKDVCQIHARLFDHRSVSQGHINMFAKEFEEKRGDREKIRLDHVKEAVNQGLEHTLPQIHNQLAEQLSRITEGIQQATESCKDISAGANDGETTSTFLLEQREARQKALDQFMEQQCVRSTRVDQQLEDNVQIFHNAFNDLCKQLSAGAPLTNQAYHKFMALGSEF